MWEGELGPASADRAPFEAWKSTAGFDCDLVSTEEIGTNSPKSRGFALPCSWAGGKGNRDGRSRQRGCQQRRTDATLLAPRVLQSLED